MNKLIFLSAFLIPTFVSAQTDSIDYKASSQEIKHRKDLLEKRKDTYSITITITHIRNHRGVILLKFFDDATPFPHKMGFRKVAVPKSQVTGDSLQVTYEI